MPLRPVPWAIGDGAENSVELARAVASIGSSGATGVVEPTDFAVSALPTPGSAVRAVQGTGVIKSTYPGVVGQSYVVQEQSHEDIPVEATGSASAVKKYVYVIIQDHQYAGPTPESVENGPYNFYEVSASLPQFQPYMLLAEINQPKSTATITNDMIIDRRELAMPRRQPLTFARPRVLEDQSEPNQYLVQKTSTGGEKFPGGNGEPNAFRVDVPEWATRILIDASWMSVLYRNGTNPWGRYWIEYGLSQGSWPNNQQYEFATQQFAFDSPSGNNMRTDWRLMSSQHLPTKLRGKTMIVSFMAGRNDTGANNAVSMDYLSGLGMHITFVQTTLDPKSNEDPA